MVTVFTPGCFDDGIGTGPGWTGPSDFCGAGNWELPKASNYLQARSDHHPVKSAHLNPEVTMHATPTWLSSLSTVTFVNRCGIRREITQDVNLLGLAPPTSVS